MKAAMTRVVITGRSMKILRYYGPNPAFCGLPCLALAGHARHVHPGPPPGAISTALTIAAAAGAALEGDLAARDNTQLAIHNHLVAVMDVPTMAGVDAVIEGDLDGTHLRDMLVRIHHIDVRSGRPQIDRLARHHNGVGMLASWTTTSTSWPGTSARSVLRKLARNSMVPLVAAT